VIDSKDAAIPIKKLKKKKQLETEDENPLKRKKLMKKKTILFTSTSTTTETPVQTEPANNRSMEDSRCKIFFSPEFQKYLVNM
jgi:hypothetical protein